MRVLHGRSQAGNRAAHIDALVLRRHSDRSLVDGDGFRSTGHIIVSSIASHLSGNGNIACLGGGQLPGGIVNGGIAGAGSDRVGHGTIGGAAAGAQLQGLTVDHGGTAGEGQSRLVILCCQVDLQRNGVVLIIVTGRLEGNSNLVARLTTGDRIGQPAVRYGNILLGKGSNRPGTDAVSTVIAPVLPAGKPRPIRRIGVLGGIRILLRQLDIFDVSAVCLTHSHRNIDVLNRLIVDGVGGGELRREVLGGGGTNSRAGVHPTPASGSSNVYIRQSLAVLGSQTGGNGVGRCALGDLPSSIDAVRVVALTGNVYGVVAYICAAGYTGNGVVGVFYQGGSSILDGHIHSPGAAVVLKRGLIQSNGHAADGLGLNREICFCRVDGGRRFALCLDRVLTYVGRGGGAAAIACAIAALIGVGHGTGTSRLVSNSGRYASAVDNAALHHGHGGVVDGLVDDLDVDRGDDVIVVVALDGHLPACGVVLVSGCQAGFQLKAFIGKTINNSVAIHQASGSALKRGALDIVWQAGKVIDRNRLGGGVAEEHLKVSLDARGGGCLADGVVLRDGGGQLIVACLCTGQVGGGGGITAHSGLTAAGDSDIDHIAVYRARSGGGDGLAVAPNAAGDVRPSEADLFLPDSQLARVVGDVIVGGGVARGRNGVLTHIAVLGITVVIAQGTAENAFTIAADKAANGHAVTCGRVTIGDGVGIGGNGQRSGLDLAGEFDGICLVPCLVRGAGIGNPPEFDGVGARVRQVSRSNNSTR